MSLEDLTRRLGQPTHGHDIGEPISNGQADGPKRKEAGWLLTSEVQRDRPLEDHIEDLLAFAEARRDRIGELRSSCAIDISCGIFRGDEVVPARPEVGSFSAAGSSFNQR